MSAPRIENGALVRRLCEPQPHAIVYGPADVGKGNLRRDDPV
jgi:hypothetical protein